MLLSFRTWKAPIITNYVTISSSFNLGLERKTPMIDGMQHTERFYYLEMNSKPLSTEIDRILEDEYSTIQRSKLMIVAALDDGIINILLYKVSNLAMNVNKPV